MYFPTKNGQLGGIFDEDLVRTGQSSLRGDFTGANILVTPHGGTTPADNFASEYIEDSNFSVSLVFHRIKPISYTFQTRTDINNLHLPVKWIIEAADSKQKKWVEVAKVDDSGFNDYGQLKTFPFIDKGRAFTHFRVTMKGLNYYGYYHFVLHRIEFFGYLYSNSEYNMACTKGKRSFIHSSAIFYMIFVS